MILLTDVHQLADFLILKYPVLGTLEVPAYTHTCLQQAWLWADSRGEQRPGPASEEDTGVLLIA